MAASPVEDSGRLSDWQRALAIVLATGVARLIVAALTPLFPDETYYWEWSRHLAAGYFDHPPAIAWLIRVGTVIFGTSALGVRFGAVCSGVVGTLFVCATARRAAGERGALVAAVVFAVMPLSAAGLVLATPDAPLLAAAAASLYAVTRALEHPPRSRGALRWWCLAGVGLGLAFASKYTSALLPVAIVLALIIRAELRVRLLEPGPYIATAIAFLIFMPVILWNARHEWVSFAFQLQHGLTPVGGSVANRELEMIGGQLGLVSPILFVMMAIAIARTLRARTILRPSDFVLAALCVFVFAFFMYSATKRRVEANWPALAYLPGTVLLVAYEGAARWRRWLRAGIGLAAVLTLVTYVNAFTPILPVRAARDPAARAAGWSTLAELVERIHATRRPLSSYRTWIAADRYQEASELAFHMPQHPDVYSLNLTGRTNQYDLWPSFAARAQKGDAMILALEERDEIPATVDSLAGHFASVSQGPVVPLTRGGDVIKLVRIWLLGGWRGTWPKRQLRSPT